MSFFGIFSRTKAKGESVLLIDISATDVGGAYTRYEGDDPPTIVYTRRMPIETRQDEPRERAMLRALDTLGEVLVREGAPALLRFAGSGSADLVLVSVDAPWQETSVRDERFDADEPFVFTRGLVMKRLAETDTTPPEQMLADESIIGTIVNGYETNAPYGRRAHRAVAMILTSRIDKKVAHGIIAVLRQLFHTRRILPIAGGSLRYQALRSVFPHERNALIIDASESLTSIALMRRGLFVTISYAAGLADRSAWVSELARALSEISTHYPLPRTIFLLAPEREQAAVKEMLSTADLGKLWLSDNPPAVIGVLRSQLAAAIHQVVPEPVDRELALMAIYYQHRTPSDAL